MSKNTKSPKTKKLDPSRPVVVWDRQTMYRWVPFIGRPQVRPVMFVGTDSTRVQKSLNHS